MIIHKKPEKIILDLLHTSEAPTICEKISRTGLSCLYMEKGNLNNVILEENKSPNTNPKEDKLEKEEWQSSLVITDDAINTWKYKSQDVAVLVYLHEGNKEQLFTKNRFFIEGFEDADAMYFIRIYQREKKLPWLIGETERLIIREMTPEDTDALYRLYEDKSVVEFMEDLPPDKKEEREYIADYIDKVYGFFGFGMWIVELKDSGEIIGRVGFQNCEEDMVELGFMVVPEYQHKGYAYEACVAAIAYMRKEFPEYRLMARCKRTNKKAIELCNKLMIECRPVD